MFDIDISNERMQLAKKEGFSFDGWQANEIIVDVSGQIITSSKVFVAKLRLRIVVLRGRLFLVQRFIIYLLIMQQRVSIRLILFFCFDLNGNWIVNSLRSNGKSV